MDQPVHILKKYWGYSHFRAAQEEVINHVLKGNDALAIMPTGGGKSICFQVPALIFPGVCLVITPLIALMQDQVERLNKMNIPAAAIHAGMHYLNIRKTLEAARRSTYKFLYVSPERLHTEIFSTYLSDLAISLIAVDEAHCISQWGYDFRPAYLRIAEIRKYLPGIPVLALTASATKNVQEDIIEKLAFKGSQIFKRPYARPNLSFSIFEESIKINKMLDVLKAVPGASIVYCRSRRKTIEMAMLLQQHQISATHYHAGLSFEERQNKQKNWIDNKQRVMVCTNAFGMGIDKPDVRSVIHLDPPDSIEAYYQEAGRAGRDGAKAYAVLLYNATDIENLREIPQLRFPPVTILKKVYQALLNFWQLPTGEASEKYFEFDIELFTERFQIHPLTVMYSLKILEQQGILYYNEQLFNPSTVLFTSNRETLENVEKAKPELDKVIKFLLRSYGGILDAPVYINENSMARVLRSTVPELKQKLNLLQKMAVLLYEEQKDSPRIRFAGSRVAAGDLQIRPELYEKRKQAVAIQVNAMLALLANKKSCIATEIALYFGDDESVNCGICHRCIENKKNKWTEASFKDIRNKVLDLVKAGSYSVNEITRQLYYEKQKVHEVIEYLMEEGSIEMHADNITLKLKGIKKGPG